MTFLQLVIKQMRQRALSTWLTLLSVLLGVSLATAVLILYRGGGAMFGQTEFGYDVIVGPPKGSPLQLVMNTVYQIDQSPGVLSYAVYEDLMKNRAAVRVAVPLAVGDSYKGHRIVGTAPKLFGFDDEGKPIPPERVLEYKAGRRFTLAEGRVFHPRKFEAVIGADIPGRTGLKLGDRFKATHGLPQPGETPDEHDTEWSVVGILEPTHTAADRVIYIPLVSFYAIREHEEGLEIQGQLRERLEPKPAAPQRSASAPATQPHDDHDHDAKRAPTTGAATEAHEDHDHDHDAAPAPTTGTAPAAHDGHDHDAVPAPTTGSAPAAHDDHAHDNHDHEHSGQFEMRSDDTIDLKLPKDDWVLSAVLVRSRGGPAGLGLLYNFRVIDNRASAASPGVVMREFFDTFFRGSTMVLLLIALLVSVVASVGILVSIYNSVSARMREIAILRALGATRARILALITFEAALIGLLGGILGLVVGHALGGAGSWYLSRLLGEGIPWLGVHWSELLYLGVVVLIAGAAGLVPALKAYEVPVATNLVAE